MNNPAYTPRQIALLSCALATLLAGGIAIASLALSGPKDPQIAAEPGTSSEAAARPLASTGGSADRCAECGIVQSSPDFIVPVAATEGASAHRSLAGDRGEVRDPTVPRRDIVIRMQDGSIMVITEPNPGNWKKGERVKILAGVN